GLAGEERARRRGPDLAGVLVARLVAEAAAHRVDLVVAVAEVALDLPADGDDRVVATTRHLGEHRALGLADHRRVVRTGEATVGGDHDEGDPADLGTRREQRAVTPAPSRRQVAHDLRDRLAVGLRRLHRGRRLDDAAGRDQLLGARDLLRRLDAPDPSPQNAFLPTSHLYALPRCSPGYPGRGRSVLRDGSLSASRDTRLAAVRSRGEQAPLAALVFACRIARTPVVITRLFARCHFGFGFGFERTAL